MQYLPPPFLILSSHSPTSTHLLANSTLTSTIANPYLQKHKKAAYNKAAFFHIKNAITFEREKPLTQVNHSSLLVYILPSFITNTTWVMLVIKSVISEPFTAIISALAPRFKTPMAVSLFILCAAW